MGEKELEMMFAEEASKMWSKQDEVWAREEDARRKLMEEVSSSWRKQLEQRMKEIEADICDLNQHILEKEKLVDQRRESLVEALDAQVQEKQLMRKRNYQEQEAEHMRQRQEEIREENKLARNLSQICLDKQDEAGCPDFRRRKVRWYF